jgi:hypothetical protein
MNCSSLCGWPDSGKVDPVEGATDKTSLLALAILAADSGRCARRFAEIARRAPAGGKDCAAVATAKNCPARVAARGRGRCGREANQFQEFSAQAQRKWLVKSRIEN